MRLLPIASPAPTSCAYMQSIAHPIVGDGLTPAVKRAPFLRRRVACRRTELLSSEESLVALRIFIAV